MRTLGLFGLLGALITDDGDGAFLDGYAKGVGPSPPPRKKRAGVRLWERKLNAHDKLTAKKLSGDGIIGKGTVAATTADAASLEAAAAAAKQLTAAAPTATPAQVAAVAAAAAPGLTVIAHPATGLPTVLPTIALTSSAPAQATPAIVFQPHPDTGLTTPTKAAVVTAPLAPLAPIKPATLAPIAAAPAPLRTTSMITASSILRSPMLLHGLLGELGAMVLDPNAVAGVDPATDPNNGNAASGSDQFGVPAGYTPSNQAWVSADLWAGNPQAWTLNGAPLKFRIAFPRVDLSGLLCTGTFDEYGRVDPVRRIFDNCATAHPSPDPFAAQYNLDDLRWDLHPPTTRVLEQISLPPGVVAPAGVGNWGTLDANTGNVALSPFDRPFWAPVGAAPPIDPTRIGPWTPMPADYWRLDLTSSTPEYFYPFLPVPIDLLSYYVAKIVPDQAQGQDADTFWKGLEPMLAPYIGVTSGALPPGGVDGIGAKQNWGQLSYEGSEQFDESAHPGRGGLTVYEAADLAAGLAQKRGGLIAVGPTAPAPAASDPGAAAPPTSSGSSYPIDPATGYPYDPATGQLLDPTTGQPNGYYVGGGTTPPGGTAATGPFASGDAGAIPSGYTPPPYDPGQPAPYYDPGYDPNQPAPQLDSGATPFADSGAGDQAAAPLWQSTATDFSSSSSSSSSSFPDSGGSDAAAGLPYDEVTGLPYDPATGLLIDPTTGDYLPFLVGGISLDDFLGQLGTPQPTPDYSDSDPSFFNDPEAAAAAQDDGGSGYDGSGF